MLRVLVVDDDETLARTLKRLLALTVRFEVVAETSPHAAIARVIETGRAHDCFDVVLCDSRMPGASAQDVIAAVREHSDAAFILMSGEDEIPDADASLLKPFGRTELVAIIDEVTRRHLRPSSLVV
jgi:CheY-like chemotaxis protein